MFTLHLSSYDVVGGAAIAAYRLHDGLRRLGVKSCMIVKNKASDDSDVMVAEQALTKFERLQRRIDQAGLDAQLRKYETTSKNFEVFSNDQVAGPDPLRCAMPKADVLNLHWVAGLVDRRFFNKLDPTMPLVWTLHDMNPFTGGCHYAFGCERFAGSCGACFQLGSNDKADLSKRIFKRKLKAVASRTKNVTRVVAPSQWLAGEARRSAVFESFSVDVIPYGLDTNIFRPRNKSIAREVFGLPIDRPVVLFISDSINNYRKGLDLLVAALSDLSMHIEPVLATIGYGSSSLPLPGGVMSLGRLESSRLLSFAYSAADLFILPTRADNLPNVVLEAMACGTPVVSFKVGGLPDMVLQGETGLLAKPEDVADLRAAVIQLLSNDPLRAAMSVACRELAVREFSLDVQARRYLSLYEKLLEAKLHLKY